MLVEKCLAELPEVISNFFMLMWLVLSVIVSYSLEIRDGQPKLTGWRDLCNIAGMLRSKSCTMLGGDSVQAETKGAACSSQTAREFSFFLFLLLTRASTT